MKSTLLVGAALAAVAAINFTVTAQAQSTTSEEVVVTGSRVITNGNNSPTPLTVVTPDQLLTTKPTTVYQSLVDLPAFAGSRGASNGPVTNSPNAAGGNQPNGAVSSLNLRNMGPLRNLVLFDGHRVPPASVDGLVDVSVLPQMLIQRVDVVTGGASAVYGSDAVTGVTNFITDTKFTGLKLNVQGGLSQQNDDGSYQVGIAAGARIFNDRGHFEVSYQHLADNGLYDTDRDWTAPRWSVQGNGTTIPWHLVSNVSNSTATFGGSIACANGNLTNCPAPTTLAGYTFHTNGVATPYDPGLTGAANGLSLSTVQIGGDGAYFRQVALKSSSKQDQFFSRFDYDLGGSVHAYIAGGATITDISGNNGTQRSFTPGWNIGACNAYLPAVYQTQLGCTAGNSGTATEPTFKFEKQFLPSDSFGVGQNNNLINHNYFFMADLAGDVGDKYKWNATYTHSDASNLAEGLNQNRQHVYAALDAVVNPANGQIVCRVTLTNPTANPGCIPLNPFGPTAASKESLYYLFDTIQSTSSNKLDGLSGSFTGTPFELWAGPVDMALSGEWRKLRMDLDTTSLASQILDCTGLRFGNCTAVPVHPNVWLPEHDVTQDVKEVAYEINVPLLKDVALAKNLAVNGAARYTQYDNEPGDSGFAAKKFNATTWKAGVVWDVFDAVTVRATRSRDIRAPSLYDLFQPITIGAPTNGFDYLQSAAGVAISPRLKSGGNPNLTPEIGDTTTAGVIVRPFQGFTVAVDYYNIDLTNAIYSLNGSSQVIQQACYASGGASSLCQLQERPNGFADTSAANAMTAFYTRSVNVAEQKTSGVDVEANWRTSIANMPLQLRAVATYQPHIYYYVPGLATQDVAGVAYPQIGGLPTPKVRGTVFAKLNLTDRFAVDVSERWRSALHFSSDPTQAAEDGETKSVAYTNLTFTYDVPVAGHASSLFLNIQNLFDKDPPAAGQLNATFPGQFLTGYAVGDDVVGRYYTVGVRLKY